MIERHLSRSDRLIAHFDSALRTVVPNAVVAQRTNPAAAASEAALDELERRHVASLMRVTHMATVSIQGLCQGQAGLIKLPDSRRQIMQSQQEAMDHLAWCNQRLTQLHSRTSHFIPVCYGASLGLGLTAGSVSERIGLGVVAATKELMGRQLNEQLLKLPVSDQRSRTLFRQIAADNTHHAQLAIEAGGARFPAPIKWGMRLVVGGMLKVAYYT
ncbi:2-polyprenyl-3-methyl-6-methoxy-1,4-benzoquinone monooxygenase [Vreelandella olivaria]|uniref:2-polyprenyl-3-methyl-6-methoxy-1,4-benzoquinone monooxygenase n=1 Tax=Vreelandella olivaria TaxID=390919 RepID=UPI0024C2648C|nr:2-polyprenyl-3-methyl-6-methoxy-1,4-benzoquinone monooxygenase [Halomonas olivaria]